MSDFGAKVANNRKFIIFAAPFELNIKGEFERINRACSPRECAGYKSRQSHEAL
jgi:hypothetical protein